MLFDLTGDGECMVVVVGDWNCEVSMMTSEVRKSASSPGKLGWWVDIVDR